MSILNLLVIDNSTEPEGAPRDVYCGTLRARTCTTLELARQLARNEGQTLVVAGSVQSMVDGILDVLRASGDVRATIGLLRIIGHGSPGAQAMGDSYTTNHPLQLIALDSRGHLLNRNILNRLRGYFKSTSIVELHGCSVGQGTRGVALLQELHALWGVTIRAGAIDQSARTPALDGPVTEASRASHP